MIDIKWHPESRFLRQFAALFIVFFGLVGAHQFFGRDAHTAGIVLWAVGGTIGGVGLVAPAFMRYVYLGWMCALYPVAWVVSHVVLAAIYFLVLTPIGLAMKLFGRDPMQRSFDPAASTYWKPRPPQTETSRYFRQF
ncbi:MAG: hypothetical protein KY476_26350 [Planctomycetes bacterium]|nr:hypothetical protein [Planctomycetota bacterium]